MAFRRAPLSSIGGFRHELGRLGTLPFGVEETEACIRLAAAMPGTSIVHVPGAVVHHTVPADRVTLSTDCGMKSLPRTVAKLKLKALADGAAIVRSEL